MNKIIKSSCSLEELKNIKNNLQENELAILTCDTSYIATVKTETGKHENNEYISYLDYIPSGFFRDCYLEKNNTISFFAKLPNDNLLSGRELTQMVANIWYYVLNTYLPLERFNFKIRDLDNKCCADFIGDISTDEDMVIGYINLGPEFNQPKIDNLIKNRDAKSAMSIDMTEFEKIANEVADLIEKMIGGEI